jgi:hypothetical protein
VITDPQALTGADHTDRTPETAAVGEIVLVAGKALEKSSGASTMSIACHPLHLGHVGTPTHTRDGVETRRNL